MAQSEQLDGRPLVLRDELAAHRTELANQRTFMATIRTALSLVGAGAALIKLLEHGLWITLGWFLAAVGIGIMALGTHTFVKTKRLIEQEEKEALLHKTDKERP